MVESDASIFHMVCTYTLLCVLVSLNVPAKEPAFVEGDVVVNEKKVTNTLTRQPDTEMLDLFIERNENIFGYFVEFSPSVSSSSLLIDEIQADKKGGQAEYGRVLLGEIEDVLK